MNKKGKEKSTVKSVVENPSKPKVPGQVEAVKVETRGRRLGSKVSEETGRRISQALKGHQVKQATRQKIKTTLSGRQVPKERIERMVKTKQLNKFRKLAGLVEIEKLKEKGKRDE